MALKYLQKIPFLRQVPGKDLNRILRLAKLKTYKKGEVIFRQEESGNHLFVVASGLIKIYVSSSTKRRKTMAILKAGDFFGEMALLDGQVRSANAMVLKPSAILMVHKNDFKRLLLSDPKLNFLVLRTLSERLRRANEQIQALLFKNVHGRVVKTLVEMAAGGKKENGGVVLAQPMTRRDLAEIVGTTREPVTRSLSMLKRAGLIEYRDKDIVIKDLARMKALV